MNAEELFAPPTDEELAEIESENDDVDPVSDEELSAVGAELPSQQTSEAIQVPQIEEKPWYSIDPAEAALAAIAPTASLVGGTVGAGGGPLGVAAGGSLGFAGGKELEKLARQYLMGQKQQPSGVMDVAGNLAAGAAQEIGGQAAMAVGRMALKYAPKAAKEGAELTKQAAERLGVTPTRGMIESGEEIARKEMGLAKSGTASGSKIKQQLNSITDTLSKAADEITSSSNTPEIYGSEGRFKLAEEMGDFQKRANQAYKEVDSHLQHIDLDLKDRARLSTAIRGISKFDLDPATSTVNKSIKDLILKTKNLKDLRFLIGEVKSAASSKAYSDASTSRSLGKVAGVLETRLESKVMRDAVDKMQEMSWGFNKEQAGMEGYQIGEELIGSLKSANKAYAKKMTDLSIIGRSSGLGKTKTVKAFFDSLDQIPDEKIIDSLFKPQNSIQLQTVKKNFPEAFEYFRKGYLSVLHDKSLVNGKVDPFIMAKELSRASDEAIDLIFEKDAQKFLDLKQVVKSMPKGSENIAESSGLMSALKEIPAFFGNIGYQNPRLSQYGAGQLAKRSVGGGVSALASGALNYQLMPPVPTPEQRRKYESFWSLDTTPVEEAAAAMGVDPQVIINQYESDPRTPEEKDKNLPLSNSEKAKRLQLLRKHGRMYIPQI